MEQNLMKKKITKAERAAEFNKKNTKLFSFRFNINSDADVISALDNAGDGGKVDLVRKSIREHISK
jgi:hypothetical protein